ncbi:MAG: tRNA (guanosine(37)-N1)-methyltransferase TrmD [Alphaproteobacteria bacterium]
MTRPWTAWLLTLFPEMFPGPLGLSLAGKALDHRLWALETVDIRDFSRDKHRSVDDTPFGGGPGMVMRPDVVADAVDATRAKAMAAAGTDGVPLLCMSARGRPLTQARVRALAEGPGAVVICGRFEGIDQRVLDARGAEEISVADVVLSGGEPAALVLLDAIVRLLPGVIGDPAALTEESFAGGLLEYPQFTRPRQWEGHEVPEVLLSGNHEEIARWRRQQAELVTSQRRRDLWERTGAGAESEDE